MPANVIEFANFANTPRPDSLFLDTSFLLHALGGMNGARQDRRSADSAAFLTVLTGIPAVETWITLAVFEEAAFKLLGGAMAAAARRAGITYRGWTDFKDNHRTSFDTAFAQDGRPVLNDLVAFLNASSIIVREPGDAWQHNPTVTRTVWTYMRYVMAHNIIEPMDALHVASALFGEATGIVSNDHGFQQLDGMVVYAHRRV